MFCDETPAEGFSGKTADFNKALRKEQIFQIVFSAAFDVT